MWDRANGPIVRSEFKTIHATSFAEQLALIQGGVVPAARLVFATDATNADTVTIGGHVFKFLTTLIAADTTTQVKRGTSAAQTLADLVKAINGTASANVVPATTPFAKTVVADAVDATHLRIRWATSRGGAPLAGIAGSIALAESLTPAASVWNCGNLNESGKAPADCKMSLGSFAVTAAMVTFGSFQYELPFTPTVVMVRVATSAGVLRSIDEAVTISGDAVNFVMAGGVSPNIQATDVITVLALA